MLNKLLSIAANHGFMAHIEGGAVILAVPFSNPQTGENGIEHIRCASKSELYAAIGY